VVRIEIGYEGELHCNARHTPSSTLLSTDAPRDNRGKGESFSPTDLVATALGTCMATTMGLLARAKGYRIDGIALTVDKHMTKDPPRRIERLEVAFQVPADVAAGLDTDAKAALQHAAETCPVALSLHQTVGVALRFDW
jgi:putative redox protein